VEELEGGLEGYEDEFELKNKVDELAGENLQGNEIIQNLVEQNGEEMENEVDEDEEQQ
jgi:hypothetical protein